MRQTTSAAATVNVSGRSSREAVISGAGVASALRHIAGGRSVGSACPLCERSRHKKHDSASSTAYKKVSSVWLCITTRQSRLQSALLPRHQHSHGMSRVSGRFLSYIARSANSLCTRQPSSLLRRRRGAGRTHSARYFAAFSANSLYGLSLSSLPLQVTCPGYRLTVHDAAPFLCDSRPSRMARSSCSLPLPYGLRSLGASAQRQSSEWHQYPLSRV